MSDNEVTQLGYLGITTSDPEQWEQFATQVLGLQAMNSTLHGSQFFRMHNNHHRIAVRKGDADDVAFLGWEKRDASSLATVAQRVESLGEEVREGTASEAEKRRSAA